MRQRPVELPGRVRSSKMPGRGREQLSCTKMTETSHAAWKRQLVNAFPNLLTCLQVVQWNPSLQISWVATLAEVGFGWYSWLSVISASVNNLSCIFLYVTSVKHTGSPSWTLVIPVFLSVISSLIWGWKTFVHVSPGVMIHNLIQGMWADISDLDIF